MANLFGVEFESDIEFERYVLSKALPIVQAGQGTISATLYLDNRPTIINVTGSATLGRSNAQVIAELGLRPLFFGAAWKILDVLVDHTLWTKTGKRQSYLIQHKVDLAIKGAIVVPTLSSHLDIHSRVLASYANAMEIRHALVHRQVTVGPSGDFTGVDRGGKPLRTITTEEQSAFCRMVQFVVSLVTNDSTSSRELVALKAELDMLTGLTNLPILGAKSAVGDTPMVVFPVSSSDEIDMALVKRIVYAIFTQNTEIDLVFEIIDRDGLRFSGELEQMPDDCIVLDSETCPPWLRRA